MKNEVKMKKLILKILALTAFLIMLTINITTIQNSLNITIGGTELLAFGNFVNCYSSLSVEKDGECGFLDPCWSAYRCGPCTRVYNVDFGSGKLACEYNPVPIGN